MSCPNDCSGHGRCMYSDEMPYGVNLGSFYDDQDIDSNHEGELGDTNGNDAVKFPYYGWDKGKSRMCHCDPGYEGVDCSYRSCPEGNDVMVERLNREAILKYQKQVWWRRPSEACAVFLLTVAGGRGVVMVLRSLYCR